MTSFNLRPVACLALIGLVVGVPTLLYWGGWVLYHLGRAIILYVEVSP